MFNYDNFNLTAWVGGLTSIGAIFSTLFGWVPPIAAVFALIWYMIQIYDSEPVQKYRTRRLRNKLLRLHERAANLEMRLVDVTDEQTLDHYKKLISMRVDVDTGLRERELNHEHANEIMRAVIDAKRREPTPSDPPI